MHVSDATPTVWEGEGGRRNAALEVARGRRGRRRPRPPRGAGVWGSPDFGTRRRGRARHRCGPSPGPSAVGRADGGRAQEWSHNPSRELSREKIRTPTPTVRGHLPQIPSRARLHAPTPATTAGRRPAASTASAESPPPTAHAIAPSPVIGAHGRLRCGDQQEPFGERPAWCVQWCTAACVPRSTATLPPEIDLPVTFGNQTRSTRRVYHIYYFSGSWSTSDPSWAISPQNEGQVSRCCPSRQRLGSGWPGRLTRCGQVARTGRALSLCVCTTAWRARPGRRMHPGFAVGVYTSTAAEAPTGGCHACQARERGPGHDLMSCTPHRVIRSRRGCSAKDPRGDAVPAHGCLLA